MTAEPQTQIDYKPTSEQVIAILENALPRIKHLQSLSYTEANKILNDDYFISQWKGRKKEFGSLFRNLDDDNRIKMLNCLEIEFSEPKNTNYDKERVNLVFAEGQDEEIEKLFIKGYLEGKFPFEFQSMEIAIIDKFCLYALNNSRTIGKKHYINVVGLIALYFKMTANEKIRFANKLIDYR